MSTPKKAAGRSSTPDLAKAAKDPAYDRAVADLEKLCGVRRRALTDAKGGFVFHLPPGKARSFALEKVHQDFLQRGCYVFDNDAAREKMRIAILPTTDKFAAVLAVGTAGPNWDIATKQVVAWLRRLEKKQPFILTGISDEHVSGRFTTKIKKPADLAMEFLEFAPDLENPVVIEEDLRKSGAFWLWWD